jgi:hypothetical protein
MPLFCARADERSLDLRRVCGPFIDPIAAPGYAAPVLSWSTHRTGREGVRSLAALVPRTIGRVQWLRE